MHLGRVPPQEEGLAFFGIALHEGQGLGIHFFVDRFHALFGERAGVFHAAIGKAVDHTAGAEFFLKLGIFGIVGVFGFFLRIQVVEVSKEFIETMGRGQHIIAVAQVVFAELASGISLGLEQGGNGGIFFFHALGGARQAYFGEAGADG